MVSEKGSGGGTVRREGGGVFCLGGVGAVGGLGGKKNGGVGR